MLAYLIIFIVFFIGVYVARDFFYEEVEEREELEEEYDENDYHSRSDYDPFVFKDVVRK